MTITEFIYEIVELPTGGTGIKRIQPNPRLLFAGRGHSRAENLETLTRFLEAEPQPNGQFVRVEYRVNGWLLSGQQVRDWLTP